MNWRFHQLNRHMAKRHFQKPLKEAVAMLLGLTALVILFSFAEAHAQQAQPWKQIPIPPLRPFHPEQPKRIELKNGMVILLEEDHELPFINGVINIRGGSRDEPANKVGLVDLYSDAWRTSGTASKDGDALGIQLASHRQALFISRLGQGRNHSPVPGPPRQHIGARAGRPEGIPDDVA